MFFIPSVKKGKRVGAHFGLNNDIGIDFKIVFFATEFVCEVAFMERD